MLATGAHGRPAKAHAEMNVSRIAPEHVRQKLVTHAAVLASHSRKRKMEPSLVREKHDMFSYLISFAQLGFT